VFCVQLAEVDVKRFPESITRSLVISAVLQPKMAAGTSSEGIELNTLPVECTVTGSQSDVEEDVDCLPSEVATALPTQGR